MGTLKFVARLDNSSTDNATPKGADHAVHLSDLELCEGCENIPTPRSNCELDSDDGSEVNVVILNLLRGAVRAEVPPLAKEVAGDTVLYRTRQDRIPVSAPDRFPQTARKCDLLSGVC